MSSHVQTVRFGNRGAEDSVQVTMKNTFLCFQCSAETARDPPRCRSFTDTQLLVAHSAGKSETMDQLSFCETVEGSHADSESDMDSWNSDGEKHLDIPSTCIDVVSPPKEMQRSCRRQSHDTILPKDYTTVMLRNVPNNYSRDMLIELLELKGFHKRFNFLYLPVDFEKCAGLGYAFVNFVSNTDATHAMHVLEGFDDWKVPSQKILRVSWSLPLQGWAANVDRYRNSAVMHPDVPQQFKPMVFENGCPANFPTPTRNITLGLSRPLETHAGGATLSAQPCTKSELAKPKPRKSQHRVPACPEVPVAEYTTVMLRNLPNDYTRDMLINLLGSAGFRGRFDFVYLPVDFQRSSGLGYAFVNFVTHNDAQNAMMVLANFDDWEVPSLKVLQLSWSTPLQGLTANVERYRNNAVMHPDVPNPRKRERETEAVQRRPVQRRKQSRK